MSSNCRHPDFEKIHSAFLSHYSKDPKLGESRYTDWVKFSGLDETQSYYLQGASRANKSKQSFEWANFLLQFVKEDKDALYYKVEALFPVESMNKDSPPFTRDEVLQAARSLTGKPSDLNHDHKKMLDGVEVVAAQFEDDCAECLLSAQHAKDAYGNTLSTSASHSVKTFANDLYYSMCVVGWRGSSALYFDTSYPYRQNTNIPFNYQEKISYTQALCSCAIYEFAHSAYPTASNYSSSICEPCIDYIVSVTRGSWGGMYFCPYVGEAGQSQDEFAGYSALMCIAAQKANSTKYSSLIAGLKDFIKWLTLPDGQICDVADSTGKLWRSNIDEETEGGFLVLPIAIALLAGAGS